jgi:hypothetical protein
MKKFSFCSLASIVCFFYATVYADFFVNPETFHLKQGDFEIWNYDVCIANMTDSLQFLGWTNFRYEKNASFFYHFYQHFQVLWTIGSFFSIAPAYRQIFVRTTEETWAPVYYPNLNLSFFVNTPNILIRDRSRVVYSMDRAVNSNHWVYRNKFSVINMKDRPFLGVNSRVEAEIFIVETRGLDEYRVSAIASMPAFAHVRLEIGYRFVSEKVINHFWFNRNVLLLNIVGSF